MAENSVGRRGFLVGSGGVLMGAALAACSSSKTKTASPSLSAPAPSTSAAAPSASTPAPATSAPAPSSAASSAPASSAAASSGGPVVADPGPLSKGTYVTNSDDDTSIWEIPLWNSQHPEFQLQLVTQNSTTYTAAFPQLATSSDAPNLAGYFIDGGTYTDLAKAGALVELSDVWEKAGLNTALPQLVSDIYHGFTPDKKVYAVPTNTSTYGCFFYSKSAFAKAGIPTPVNNAWPSLAAFESAMAAGKKAGFDGIAMGGKDGYPLSHLQDGILSSYLPPDQVRDVLNIDYTASTWTTPVQTMLDWAKKGYYSKGYLGMDATAAKTYFAQGKSLLCMAINVWLPDIVKAGKPADDIDWVLVPQVGPLPAKTSFYAGGGLIIPAKAPGGPDYAQAKGFIEWAVSPGTALLNAQKVQAYQGRSDVPGLVEALGPTVASMFAYAQKQQGWDDPAPSDMITYDRSNLQAVLAGTLSVSSFGSALQKLAAAHKASGK
jgi:ABC-type glycerol-3-phosphate transport system substrate-binding protein